MDWKEVVDGKEVVEVVDGKKDFEGQQEKEEVVV